MKAREHVIGVVLAGGRSSRMGGGDKCLLPLAGEPILAHVIERLKPQLSEVIISGNGDPARFAPLGLPVVEDCLGDFAGPLAGIHAGLAWARANRPESRFVITAASDTPFLPTNLVSRFRAAIGQSEPKLLVARSEGGLHQTFGLWPVSLADALGDSLKMGARKVSDWVRQHQAIEVIFPEVEAGGRRIDPFFNINWPDELIAAEAFLEATTV